MFTLKEYRNNDYFVFKEQYVDFKSLYLSQISEEVNSHIGLLPSFTSFQIPEKIVHIVSQFCSENGIKHQFELLLNIIAGAQCAYIDSKNHKLNDPMVKAYETERLQLKEVLCFLEDYWFNKVDEDLKIIKFLDSGRRILNASDNPFVLKRIISSLTEGFGLDNESQERFKLKSHKILDTSNQMKFARAEYYIKGFAISGFYSCLNDLDYSENKKYSIVGVFLNCAQVSLTEKHKFTLSDHFNDNLNDTYYENIRKLKSRLHKSFYK